VREIKFLKFLQHKSIVQLKDVVSAKGCEDHEFPTNLDKRPDAVEKRKREETDDPRDMLSLCGNLYFVFEYVEHDLGGLIDAKYSFQSREIKSIIKQLLEALEYLHERKIIHRDIKSSNILISNLHQVKLADFGLARTLPSTEMKDKADMTNNVITLWYRPPELLLGSVRYTPTIDIWSAACVLAELELGRPFLPGKTEVSCKFTSYDQKM
jgi:cyclin-dependent kinase 12/13